LDGDLELLGRLALAFGLSAAIGLERELRQKSAGLRTYTLVGLGAALFSLAGAYGFGDVPPAPGIPRDPSRVAAQVVTGIGFIGAGLIFVRRESVRGLTTAAGVWLTAAVGLAAAAGEALLAVAATVAHMVVAFGFPSIARRLPSPRTARAMARVTYLDGLGVLRVAIAVCTQAGFSVVDISTQQIDPATGADPGTVAVRLELQGVGDAEALQASLADLDGVLAASVDRPDDAD
jgi:putative Mg2+ transporter-C (MgtC) family protein